MSDAMREMKNRDARFSVESADERRAPLVLTPDLRVLPQPEAQPAAPALSLQETIAELEATLLAQTDDWDADQDDLPQARPTAASTAVPVATAGQKVDEDALRKMVAELVRAELRGALGEKITHNVRKLVRAEIARALAAQEPR